MNYTITQEDIDAYLASKQDDDQIGIACDSMLCLVAEVAMWKYHLKPGDVSVDGEALVIFKGDEILARIELHEEICTLIERFDNAFYMGKIVTKWEWLEAREVKA